ncbi:hypothetical protein N9Y92_00510 [Chlamydiales bacterium]|nr:hypothetical protein [Chlamydiales bacterium]
MTSRESRLYTVRDFCEKNPSWPSESALRAIILGASWGENKFQSAFKRVGRRVLVDEAEFWLCVDRMQEGYKDASNQ